MEWLKKVFSGTADMHRVNPAGLVVMALAVLIVMFAGKIAGKLFPGRAELAKNFVKLAGVAVCAAGALIAICA